MVAMLTARIFLKSKNMNEIHRRSTCAKGSPLLPYRGQVHRAQGQEHAAQNKAAKLLPMR